MTTVIPDEVDPEMRLITVAHCQMCFGEILIFDGDMPRVAGFEVVLSAYSSLRWMAAMVSVLRPLSCPERERSGHFHR